MVAFFYYKPLLLPEILSMSFSLKIKSSYKPKRLAVKLNAKGELFVVQGHPWVFSNNITKNESCHETAKRNTYPTHQYAYSQHCNKN